MMPTLAAAATSAHVLVANVDNPELEAADRHHLERVLRLRPGTTITVGDGAGRWRVVHLSAHLDPVGAVVQEPAEQRPITIAFALTKGDKPDLVVQKLTELGVDTIVVFPSARSVAKWESDRVEAQLKRLQRVAIAAVCQSRRAWSPSVSYLGSFAEAACLPGSALAAMDGARFDGVAHRALLVGPEGGWDADELAVSVPRVSVGPHVLRAETAALAVASVACADRYYLK
jgi:16S rRNA (uracil1498-N3)-methyltransferase